jgi:hypothetical protein
MMIDKGNELDRRGPDSKGKAPDPATCAAPTLPYIWVPGSRRPSGTSARSQAAPPPVPAPAPATPKRPDTSAKLMKAYVDPDGATSSGRAA